MRVVWARPGQAEDIVAIDARLRSTPDNLLDADILTYANVRFACVGPVGNPDVTVPWHPVWMLESLAVKDGTDARTEAKALEVLVRHIVSLASEHSVNEIYFLCRDKRVVEFARHYGFERLIEGTEADLLRIKVNKLC